MATEPIYSIAREGKTLGQFTLAQVREGLKSGQVKVSDHFWTQGMGDWSSVSALAKKISEDAAEEERRQASRRQAEQLAAKREAEQRVEFARRQAEDAAYTAQRKQAAREAEAARTAAAVARPPDVPAAVGASLIFVGGFMPMLAAPIFSGASLSLIGNGTGETAICAYFAARAAVSSLCGLPAKVAEAFWAGVALLAIPILKFLYLMIKLDGAASRLGGGSSRYSDSGWSFSYNPFGGVHLSLVELLPIPLDLGLGFACVLLGTAILYRAKR